MCIGTLVSYSHLIDAHVFERRERRPVPQTLQLHSELLIEKPETKLPTS